MTDIEFYTKALRLQSWVLKQDVQIKACEKYWSADFCKRHVIETFEKFSEANDVREVFSLENLTKERASAIGFDFWNREKFPNLMLFPLWYVFLLPYGTKIMYIDGKEDEFTEKTDRLDVSFGCVSFGINIEK